MPLRSLPVKGFFRLFATVCLLGTVLFSSSCYHLYDVHRTSFRQDRSEQINGGVSSLSTPSVKMATTKSNNVFSTVKPPENLTITVKPWRNSSIARPTVRVRPTVLVRQTLQCKTVCSKSSGGVCVPLDLAFFIYKDNLPLKKMTFVQNSYPILCKPSVVDGKRTSPVKVVKRCNVEEDFPDIELVPRQGSCAVIGNSGILNNSSCGEYIDSHDFVIRGNMGLIKGFENDVGKRANLTAFNSAMMTRIGDMVMRTDPSKQADRKKFLDYIHTLGESILWYPKKLSADHRERFRAIVKYVRDLEHSGVRFAFNWTPIHVERSYGVQRIATLGLDMYAVARTFCSNITLFGFFPFHQDLEGRDIKYHYFEDIKFNFTTNKAHNFNFEYNKLKALEAEGKLKFVDKDCKPRTREVSP